MTTYTITYADETGETYTAAVWAATLDDADDAATDLVAGFARMGRHITIVSVR